MDMEVGDGLPAIRAIVDDDSEAALFDARFSRDFLNREEKLAEQVFFNIRNQGDTVIAFFWNHEHMHGSLGSDVFECQDLIVLEEDFCGNFTVDNFFENGFAHVAN